MEPDAKALADTNVVFIDTNLDTHLALIVSHLDTVSDLKKRILSEHPSCFPKIGQIQIHAIKVKRKGYFYHLSDSMFVRSAFNAFNKSWFLSVDASTLGEHGHNGQSFSPGSPNQVACLGIANNALIGSFDNPLSCPSKRLFNFPLPQLENKQAEKEEIPAVWPSASVHTGKEAVKNLETGVKYSDNNDPLIQLPGSIPETQRIECEVYGSSKVIKDDSNVCEEGTLESVPSAKKKQKSKRKKEDKVQDDTSKENNVVGQGNDTVKQDIAVPGDPSDNELQIRCRAQLHGPNPETQDYYFVNHELPSSHIECEVGGSSKCIKDDCNVCEEETLKSVANEKKKRKSKRKKEDKLQDDTSKVNAYDVGPSKDTVEQEIVVPEDPSENADKGVSNEISIRENNTADGLCWDSSSGTRKRSSSRLPMSNEEIKETEVLKEHQHTECNNKNTKNNTDAEYNELMKDVSEPGPAANKKHRKRKRSLTDDSKEEMLNVEMASQKDEAQKYDEAGKQSKEFKDQAEFNNDKSWDEVEFHCDKVTEEVLGTRPPAKKKLKGKEKSGDKISLKDKQSVISDSNVEKASHDFLEDQQKIKYSSTDHSTEHINDTGPLRTTGLGGRRKGKKNSSNTHQTAGVTSSRTDDETDHSRIQGAVQEEISEDGLISKDISMNKTPLDKVEIRTDACKEDIQSKVKRTENPKNHCATDMKVHPSDVNEPKELNADDENIVLDHCHKSEADQTEGAEEGREISPQDDPKPMLSEKCTPSNQDNIDVNIRELTVTSKVLDVNGIAEPVKSEKKRRERRKAKHSDAGPALREGIGLLDASESQTIISKSLKAINGDPETEENPLNQTEGKNVQQEEMKGTFLSVIDREDDINADNAGSLEQIKTHANAVHMDKRQRKKSNNKQNFTDRDDDINADEADSLEQIKTQANAEHVDKRQRKKSNNKQSSTANSISYMLTKDQVLDCKNPSPSSDSRTLAEPSFKITKKTKSASTKSTNKSSKTNLEANDATKDSTCSSGDQDDNNLEAPSKTDKISADQQFASLQQQHEAKLSDDMIGDKTNGADRTDIDLISGKNMQRLGVTKGETHAESLSSTQRVLSKEEGDVLRIHPDMKVPNVHRSGQEAKLSSLSNSITSSIEAKRKSRVKTSGTSMHLEKQREHFPISNSKFKKLVQNKTGKAHGNSIGGVVSNTWQKKSLLTGTIFKDASSGTSEDEDVVDNSDASTRTPSDNSLLSDYSDGESSSGSYGGKRLENGGRSALKAGFSGTKGISIDHILRSSSRYKKAKITASQLEETESQPVNCVPDSLADT